MAPMRLSTFQRLAFALLACAGVMIFPCLLRPVAHADMAARPANEAASRSPFAIHLRRGIIDTWARRDLDTSAQDRHAQSAELSAQGRATTAELRLVQFAGPIQGHRLDHLTEARAEV